MDMYYILDLNDTFIDKDTEQIIKQLKKLYYDKYGDDGK